MQLSEFDYHLPLEQIAQEPADQRDRSRLLLLPRKGGPVEHRNFADFPKLLKPGDLLVLNDTRVIPARLRGRKQTGGKIEVLLDRPQGPLRESGGQFCQDWSCLLHASRPLREGARVVLNGGGVAIGLGQTAETRQPRVQLQLAEPVDSYLEKYGEIPLPAYIQRSPDDRRFERDGQRYQTVYARLPGAVAAPTAGLHFTEAILEHIKRLGVEIACLTLHVGPGTFLPVRTEQVENHSMHSERYQIPEATARVVSDAKRNGRRVIAVGTTVVRSLEGAWSDSGLEPGQGETSLFIRPGYEFQVVDALLTNFHLPRSTLLMLVCAFAGTGPVLSAYREAVERGYRFYSYGDAMFLR